MPGSGPALPLALSMLLPPPFTVLCLPRPAAAALLLPLLPVSRTALPLLCCRLPLALTVVLAPGLVGHLAVGKHGEGQLVARVVHQHRGEHLQYV